MAETANVATESSEVKAMRDSWDLVAALMGGTKAMREAGAIYMPKWPSEPDNVHQQRIRLATLRPVYKRTVAVMAGKPMSKPITLPEDMPKQVQELMDNVDRVGRNLDTFVGDVLESAIGYGQCHVFVDVPPAKPPAPGRSLSIAEERAQEIRPYFVKVEAKQLVGWKASESGRLLQVRYRETVKEPDGAFGEKEVKQIRVLEPGKWAIWRTAEGATTGSSQWTVYKEGVSTLPEVPWVTVYGRRKGLMTSEPPMIELAHLNVKHWQSQSDQDNITHVARVPILVAAGVGDEFELVVGAQAAVKMPPAATLTFTEHSGAAMKTGKESLDDLVEEMRQAGAEMLIVRGTAATATEIATENNASMSDLQRIVRGAQDAIDLAISYMAKWMKQPEPDSITIYNDFEAALMAETSANLVLQGTTAGLLSKETAFKEWQRRGVISGELDYEEEQARMEAEGPPEGNIDPVTGLPYTKPTDPAKPGAKIDPHTGLPFTTPVQPVPPMKQ